MQGQEPIVSFSNLNPPFNNKIFSFYCNIRLPFIENHGNIFVTDVFEKHTKGKRKKCNRYIPLSKTAEDLFRREYELQTNANEDSFVFSFTNGLNPVSESSVYRHLHKFCGEADITYRTPHKMRFWAVTKMYEAGVDQAGIQYTAGHACPSTTDHYKRPSRLGLITTMKINEIFD